MAPPGMASSATSEPAAALDAKVAKPPPVREPAWDDLRFFLAVVAHGSLTGAARSLAQSQATVGRRIRALEEELGVDLFERGPNRLALSEAGRAVLEAASPMAEAARSVAPAAAAYRLDAAAPVRVTATGSVTMFLSQHAPLLARAAAGSEVAFVPTRRKLDIARGEADIALRMRSIPEDEKLIVRRIGRIAITMYDRADHESHAVIAQPDDPNLSRLAAFVTRFAGDRPVAARIGDMPIRYQAAKAGLGAACLPCWLGDQDPALRRLTDPPAELIEDVYLVTHSRRRPVVAAVAGALAEIFRRHARALEGSAPR